MSFWQAFRGLGCLTAGLIAALLMNFFFSAYLIFILPTVKWAVIPASIACCLITIFAFIIATRRFARKAYA